MKKNLKQLASAAEPAATEPGAALLDAAREIFVQEGVKGLSVRRVADKAGCTTMAVYSRFQGKEGLLSALYDEGFDKLAQAQLAVKPALAGSAKLLAFCHAYRTTALANPHHYALMLGQFSGEHTPTPASQLKALATLDRLTDAVAATTSMKGKRRKQCAEVASRLFAFCHGWVSLERIGFFGDAGEAARQFERAVWALCTTEKKPA